MFRVSTLKSKVRPETLLTFGCSCMYIEACNMSRLNVPTLLQPSSFLFPCFRIRGIESKVQLAVSTAYSGFIKA